MKPQETNKTKSPKVQTPQAARRSKTRRRNQAVLHQSIDDAARKDTFGEARS